MTRIADPHLQRSHASGTHSSTANTVDVVQSTERHVGVRSSSVIPLVPAVEQPIRRTPSDRDTRSAPASAAFSTWRVDGMPDVLADCYKLRYQVYCIEREFLVA